MRTLLAVTVFVAFTFGAVGLLSYGLYTTTMKQIEIMRTIDVAR